MFRLIGSNGEAYDSDTPGTLGGHRRLKGYGRLDCPNALRWIARGHYVRHRVFFANEATAIAAGYRPCSRCLQDRYAVWKADPVGFFLSHEVGEGDRSPSAAKSEWWRGPAPSAE